MSASRNVRAGRAYVEINADSSKLQANLSKARAALQGFGRAAQAVGRDLLALGTVAAAPFALATKNFAAFDDTMRLVQGVTGATGKAFEDLTKKAQALGRETSFTAQQAAEAMVSLGRMGFAPQEIQDAIGSVLDLSRATGTDLAQSADIAANSMRIFGIDAEEMARVADILSATANGSAQTLVDLFEALKVAGPQAVAAGEDITQTAAAIGVLANVGIKGSLAGTALRKSFSQFASKDVQAYLADFGVKTVDATGNLRAMADVMRDLAGVMATLPTADKLAFAEQVFDLRGSLAGLSMTADPAALDAFLAKLEDVNGTASKTAKTMDEGLGGSFRLFTSAVEGSMNATGAALAETLQPLTKRVTDLVNALTGWIQNNKGTVTSIALVAGGAVALGAALMALGAMAKLTASGITTLKTAVSGVEKLFALAAAKIRAYIALCKSAGVATATLKGAMAALKTLAFAGVLAGIAGAFYALSQRAKGAQKALEDVERSMADAREAGDRQRATDQARLKRLEQLAEKESRNAAEMREAADLAEALSQRYSRLGISVDEAAGSIEIAAGAQERLNRAQKAGMIADLEAEVKEAEANARKIQNAIRQQETFLTKWGYALTFNMQGAADDMGALLQELDAAEARLRAANDRLRAAHAGNDASPASQGASLEELEARIAAEEAAATATAESTNTATASLEERARLKEEAANATKRLAEIEAKLAEDTRSDHEREIDDVIALRDEYLALLDVQRKAAAVAGESVAGLDEKARAIKTAAEARLLAIEAEEAARRAATVDEAREEYAEAVAGVERSRAQGDFARNLEALQGQDAGAAVTALERIMARVAEELTRAAKAYRAALDEATADGEVTDAEANAMRAAQARFSALEGQRERLQQQLAAAREAADRTQKTTTTKTVGAFYAAALRGLGLGNTERALKASESTAKNTKKTVSLLEALADKELAFI